MPFYEILSENSKLTILADTCWQILEDPDGTWTIDDVSQPPLLAKFHTNVGLNFSINTYWIQMKLINKMDHASEIFFRSNAPFHDVFIKTLTGNWSHLKTGWLIPWSQKDGMRGADAISVSIPAGEELILYRRIEYNFAIDRPEILRVGIQFTKNPLSDSYIYSEGEMLEKFLLVINFSLFLLTAFLSFFFYRITYEKVFIRGAIGYFFISLLFFTPVVYIIFKEQQLLVRYAWRVLDSATFFVVVYVMRGFLQVKERFAVWDKILIVASLIPLIDLVFRLVYPAVVIIEYQSILVVLLLATCLYLIKHRNKSARIFVIGLLPLFTYLLCDTLVEILNTPPYQTYWTGVGFIAYLWLVISINRILFYRYKQLQSKLIDEQIKKEQLAREGEIEKRVLIQQQKVELEHQVAARTEELRQSLEHLRSTQSQLILSEKMASLGELTAGIAHEIQNPLNFVNNFSEINNELIDELKAESAKPKEEWDEALLKDTFVNLKDNEQKIVHHGKRAADIVKSMLQHSRASAGKKELTDINALCDEYLRLAYHGLRAKDKSFNATMKTDFDSAIGNVNVVPQDIGRVILNLITNAFYVVNERYKAESLKSKVEGEKSSYAKSLEDTYEPTVSVSTKKIGDKILISVKDNGNGIPDKIKEKIFQPFFTTKPTGQGTGLGLSLSYDIVKAHGGEILVESEEGKGTEFKIKIPVL